jgi:hypothetical protein
MFRRFALLAVAALLSACAANQVNHDFDASRDFAAYRSWSWKEPVLQYRPDDPRIKSDLTEQRIRQSVTEQLDQRGLRPAAAGAKGDVSVQTYLIVEERQQQVTTNYGGGWGNPWNGYWGAPMYNETRLSTTRWPPSRSTCSMARTANWCGAAVTNRCSAAPPIRRIAAMRFAKPSRRILANYPPQITPSPL